MVFGNPTITISIDHVKSMEWLEGRKTPIIWWGSYIKGDKGRTDLWGTGQWWLEAPGLHGADDPLLQGPNLAVKRDGIDLVAHYLGFDMYWLFVEDYNPQTLEYSIIQADDHLWFYNQYPEHMDTKMNFNHWWFEKTDKWPDWKRWIDDGNSDQLSS